MTEFIAVSTPTDEPIRDIAIERLPSGHLASPWFQIDGMNLTTADPAKLYGEFAVYQQIRNAAFSAFAAAVKQDPFDLMLSEHREPNGDFYWRVSTRFPCAAVKKPAAVKLAREMEGAIEV